MLLQKTSPYNHSSRGSTKLWQLTCINDDSNFISAVQFHPLLPIS